jgi:hypothetical protein
MIGTITPTFMYSTEYIARVWIICRIAAFKVAWVAQNENEYQNSRYYTDRNSQSCKCMPDALELSLFTGVVGFVGAFAITF